MPGVSLSCFTLETKTTQGEITAQLSKYSWELRAFVSLWPYCIITQESTKLQPAASFLPAFGNLFRSGRSEVLGPPEAQTNSKPPPSRPGHRRHDQCFLGEVIQHDGFGGSLTCFVGGLCLSRWIRSHTRLYFLFFSPPVTSPFQPPHHFHQSSHQPQCSLLGKHEVLQAEDNSHS